MKKIILGSLLWSSLMSTTSLAWAASPKDLIQEATRKLPQVVEVTGSSVSSAKINETDPNMAMHQGGADELEVGDAGQQGYGGSFGDETVASSESATIVAPPAQGGR